MKFYRFVNGNFKQFIAYDGTDTLFLNYFSGKLDSAEWADEDFSMEEWMREPGANGPNDWEPYDTYKELFIRLCFAPNKNLELK